jgi:hypothetical protein
VDRSIRRLNEAGFTVLGNYPDNKAEEADLQEQLDLEAAAKQVRALAPLESEDTKRALGEWVASEDLSLLVWFARPDPAKPRVLAHLIAPAAPAGADREQIGASRAVMDVGMRALRPE